MLQSRRYSIPSLETVRAGEKILGSFDVDHMEIETLLFQTGYLTLKSVQNTKLQISGVKGQIEERNILYSYFSTPLDTNP